MNDKCRWRFRISSTAIPLPMSLPQIQGIGMAVETLVGIKLRSGAFRRQDVDAIRWELGAAEG